jgi:hypothetical protein
LQHGGDGPHGFELISDNVHFPTGGLEGLSVAGDVVVTGSLVADLRVGKGSLTSARPIALGNRLPNALQERLAC